jgi:hypothetical protein
MERIEITPTLLISYFKGTKKHAGYDTAKEMYNDLSVHANGGYPKKLIEERRPSESETIKKYRKAIYQSVTKDPIKRVMASLTKIKRSADWSVSHPTEEYPNTIPQEERLWSYTDGGMPVYKSLEKWLFSICLKNYLLDANAVVLVKPYSNVEVANDYLRPVPVIYNSDKVIEFIPEQLLIVRLDERAATVGNEFLVVTDISIQKWSLSGKTWTATYEYPHELGVLPAFKVAGDYHSTVNGTLLFESRISPMLPRLNDAAREYSDLQAEVVQHIHSEKWVWAGDKCPRCRDKSGVPSGFINLPDREEKVVCPTCRGNLTVPSSPYLQTEVRPTSSGLDETSAPIPPAGYITKPTDIVKIQDERVDKHLFKALASINMQFLDQTPMNISGKGKEVDKDELNNFVYSVASDLVRILANTYELIIHYRYRMAIADFAKRKRLLPTIKVPQKFDLLSSNYLSEELKQVKDAGVNPVIIGALERDFAAKKFYADDGVRELVRATLELDPLAGVSDENKMLRLSNGGISRIDYVISSNITEFVRDAMEDKRFVTLTRSEKVKAIRALAEVKMKEVGSRIPLDDGN